MAESRLRRFVGGLGLGYVHTIVVIALGLWLTPYLLRHLGTREYGLWLIGAQVVVYLGLLDLGVVALVPRDVAAVVGRTHEGGMSERRRAEALQSLVAQTVRIVLVQLPVVAVAGALVVWLLPSAWEPLRWPLAFVVAAFVVTFPLRILGALLQGLQDLTFLGTVQLSAWLAGTATTVACIVAGAGLYSLVGGWVVTQGLSAFVSWRRIRTTFPDVIPRRLPSISLAALRAQLQHGTWITVHQIAQVLLGGTDLMVVGRLLGPEAVVPYACTGKLVSLLANQPQLFMQTALPALSELRGSAPRQRLFDVSRSMSQVLLLGSGGIVVVVLAVNEPFVRWWVGESAFAGGGLTAVLLAGMLLRHLNLTAIYTLFCFGHERRLALTSVADGVCGVVAMLVLVPLVGLYGAALGPVFGTLFVSLPNNLRALAREEGTSVTAFLRPLGPWFARFALVVTGAAALTAMVPVRGPWVFVPVAAAVATAYAALLWPVLRTPPLGDLVAARLAPWLSQAPAWSRRFVAGAPEVTRG
jgi:O-antigen/teichoic acid export membrane protein